MPAKDIEKDMEVVMGPPPTPPDDGRVTIVLEESPAIPPNGLFIGHNGVGYLLRAGEPVPVPKFLLSVLDDAIEAVPQVDPQSLQVTGYRDKTRFPYRVVRG